MLAQELELEYGLCKEHNKRQMKEMDRKRNYPPRIRRVKTIVHTVKEITDNVVTLFLKKEEKSSLLGYKNSN